MEWTTGNQEQPKIYGVYKFFCWCSGARLYLLKKCPTDFNIFFGIGIIVFLTGVMASISGSYAFYTVFQNTYLAMVFGAFWGVLIFFFDWYLVASLRKERRFGRELLTASPRIILALFLAIVISRPLELKLFENEINEQISKIGQVKYNDYKEVVNKNFNELEQLKDQNNQYQRTIDQLLTQRNDLFQLFVEEAEGQSPTGKEGKGPVYREKKAEYDRVNKIYESEKSRLYPIIESNNKRIARLNDAQDKQLTTGSVAIENANGFLARIQAYGELGEENKSVKYTGWFILLMFMCIETGPMFVKLISRRGAYDELIRLEEMVSMSDSEQKLIEVQERTHRLIEIERQKTAIRLQEELTNNQEFVKMVMKAQADIGVEKIKRWKEREFKLMDENLDGYRPTIAELIEEAKKVINPN